jgi:hypothetical protein
VSFGHWIAIVSSGMQAFFFGQELMADMAAQIELHVDYIQ